MEQLEMFPKVLHRKNFPTNMTTKQYPIHRWFNFIAGFSPEFVSWCIEEAKLGVDDVVVDPFSGASTTLVQANFHNVRSVGFEVHPFFYDMSLAKILPPTQSQYVDEIENVINERVESYTGAFTDIWTQDASTFLIKLFSESTLRFLASALLVEDQIEPSRHPLYRLIMSRVLELTSQAQTDGIYKAPTSEKNSIAYQIALRKVCNEIREDTRIIREGVSQKASLYSISSEKMSPLENESCALCITSPPYLNNFDFAEMTRMELYYWRYAGSWAEITERVRRRLIVNTTTAPTDLKRAQAFFSGALSGALRAQLQPIVDALKEKRLSRAGKKDYYLLVYPYFAQMQSVIREIYRVLRPKSSFHLVVADAALYGVHIPTEILLSMLMQESGFEIQEVERLRDRGQRWILQKRQGSTKMLGEFHIHARRI
jgi:DNA modification methylase